MPPADARNLDVTLATVEKVERLVAEAKAPITRYMIHKRLREQGTGTTPARLNRALEYSKRMGHVADRKEGLVWVHRVRPRAPKRPNTLRALVDRTRPQILAAAARHKVDAVSLFGSLARDEAKLTSDVDLLIDPAPGFTVFDHARLLRELRKILKREVDVVTRDSLHPLTRDRVLRELVPL